jgi:Fe-S-cluster containining protein
MATKTKKLRKLQAIYDQMPTVECTGACTDECTLIPMTPLEAEAMKKASLRPLKFEECTAAGHVILVPDALGNRMRCPMLVNEKCSVYQARPFICRAYGVSAGLECREGCKTDNPLTKEQAMKLLHKVSKL